MVSVMNYLSTEGPLLWFYNLCRTVIEVSLMYGQLSTIPLIIQM